MFPLIGLLSLFDAKVRLVLNRTNRHDDDHPSSPQRTVNILRSKSRQLMAVLLARDGTV